MIEGKSQKKHTCNINKHALSSLPEISSSCKWSTTNLHHCIFFTLERLFCHKRKMGCTCYNNIGKRSHNSRTVTHLRQKELCTHNHKSYHPHRIRMKEKAKRGKTHHNRIAPVADKVAGSRVQNSRHNVHDTYLLELYTVILHILQNIVNTSCSWCDAIIGE